MENWLFIKIFLVDILKKVNIIYKNYLNKLKITFLFINFILSINKYIILYKINYKLNCN